MSARPAGRIDPIAAVITLRRLDLEHERGRITRMIAASLRVGVVRRADLERLASLRASIATLADVERDVVPELRSERTDDPANTDDENEVTP